MSIAKSQLVTLAVAYRFERGVFTGFFIVLCYLLVLRKGFGYICTYLTRPGPEYSPDLMALMLTWTIRYAVVCTITPFLSFAQTVNDEDGAMDPQPNLIFFLKCIVTITHPTTCWCLLKLFWWMTSTSNAEWLRSFLAVDVPLKEPKKPREVLYG